jgi:hypothetical protein
MAATKLTTREKRLLALCFSVLALMATMILLNGFLQRRSAALATLARLESEANQNQTWLSDREYWEKHSRWLEANMPTTDSLGRAQGQLLEEIQNAALDLELQVERQTLLEPVSQASYREVSVNVRLKGDQEVMLRWLTTFQSPELFQHIKQLEFEIDTRSRTPKPQAQCDLTVARWFKPDTSS